MQSWYNGAVAELSDGALYPLTFYDPVRLAQDLAGDVEQGNPCMAELALIVVPKVTEAVMRESLGYLFRSKWFDHLSPSTARSPVEALRLAKAGF